MALFEEGLQTFVATGITEFFLPFLLLFTFTLVTLRKAGLFGKRMFRVNVVIALSLSLMATRFITSSISFTSFISKIVLILVGLFFFQFLLALLHVKVSINDSAWFQLAILFGVIGITLYEFGIIQNIISFFTTINTFEVMTTLLFFSLITGISVLVYRAPVPAKQKKLKPIVTEGSTDSDSGSSSASQNSASNRPSQSSTENSSAEGKQNDFDRLLEELRQEGKNGRDNYNEPRRVVETEVPPQKK